MTDKSPTLLATADLSPVSPSPVHPSSPIVVPALQEQVDHIDAMTVLQASQLSAIPAQINQTAAGAVDAFASVTETTDTTAQNPDAVQPTQDNEEDADKQDIDQGRTTLEHSSASEGVDVDGESATIQDDEPAITNSSEAVSTLQTPYNCEQDNPVNGAKESPADPNVTSNLEQPTQSANDAAQDIETIALENSVPLKPSTEESELEQRKTSQSESDGASTHADSSNPATAVIQDSNSTLASMQTESARNAARTAQQEASVPGLQGAPQIGLAISAASKPSSLPPRPPVSVGTLPQVPQSLLVSGAPGTSASRGPVSNTGPDGQGLQRWDTFQQEERKYVAEAKWDRFPDGSRLFIGNLSSERVSKREVFDIFSPFGRLAQISLKQAFGFVQYHTLEEGQAAMDNLQGREIKGRKIHLEFSRTQKRNDEGDRQGTRGKGNRRDSNEAVRPRRDDYRPGREPSPRRGSHKPQGAHGDPQRHDSGRYGHRGRSRSPRRNSYEYGGYRRRSPSPPRRHEPERTLDLPRRYGNEVPDVQFLLLQEVERDFVSWVQRAFADLGLRVDVMFLNPRFPRDAVIQRQVIEGVHAVAELDYRAQQLAKIPLQVFDRSAGYDKVRYDQYQDLDPHIAAQLVARTKAQGAQYTAPYGGSQYPPAPHYPHHDPAAQPSHGYGSQPYPHPGQVSHQYGAPSPGHGSLDNATLQQILGSIHNQQGSSGQPMMAANGGGPVDVHALLATLGHNAPGAPGPHYPQQHGHAGAAHPQPPPPHHHHQGGGDSAQHVQNIMSQLARYRQ